MRCELIQPLDVHRFAAFAEMAVYVKRPEMQALCRAAQAIGGVITPEAVRSVLPDASNVAITNIIDWCREIGLCDGRGGLTEAGEQAASAEGEAPLLEQGVYAMWGVEHPVLGSRILHWERIRIDRSDEGTAAPLPMQVDRNRAWRSVITGKRFEVRDLPTGNSEPLGYTDPQHQSACEFRWAVDFHAGVSSWTLAGSIAGGREGNPGPIRSTPTDRPCDLRTLADRWMRGVAPSEGRWNLQQRRLDVAFRDSLDDGVRQTFQTSVLLAEVEGPDEDFYEDVRVAAVPVGPATPEDARRWMLWRLRRRLSEAGYRSLDALNADYAAVTEGTPLEPMTTAPEPEEILKDARNDRPVFWRVAAGLDLNCERRAATAMVTTSAQAAHSSLSSLRVARDSNLSMQELLDRLLATARPRRVLICDRFVRGDGNLACLKVLHQALRQKHPSVRLLVLTDRDPEDPKQAASIQQIVGEAPLWYEQAFGRVRAEQPFAPRRVMGVTELFEQILMAEPIDGVTFTGGEPFAQAAALAELAERLQSRKLSLMAFTGYGLEELTGAEHVRFLRCLDVVVTGRFVNELKAEGLLWRGSSNQEVHLLTDRHAGLAVCDTEHPSAEVVITHNGTQIVSGFPESGLLRQLDPVGVNRPGHGPPQ